MKVAPLIGAALVIYVAIPGSIQEKGKPKFCKGEDGKRYKKGESYEDKENCIRYTCAKIQNKLEMKKENIIPCTGDISAIVEISQQTKRTITDSNLNTVLIYKVYKAMESSCYSKYTKISPYPAASSKSLSECQTICANNPECGAILMLKASVESGGSTSCYMIKPNNLFNEGTCTWGSGSYNVYEKKFTVLIYKEYKGMESSCYSKYTKISPYPAASSKSLSECQTICSDEPECGAILMLKSSVESGGTTSCYMIKPNNLFNEGTCTWGNGNYNAYEKKATGCVKDDNIDYYGNDIPDKNGIVNGLEGCIKWCGDTTACKYWTFAKSNQRCWLKTSDSGKKSDVDNISGTKNCITVCTADATNEAACFCKSAAGGAGEDCTPEQKCNGDGTCQDGHTIACPVGWTSLSTGCYLFHEESGGDYEEAKAVCQDKGGFLAEINNQEEQNTLWQFCQDNEIDKNIAWWLGASDKFKEGEWKWERTGEIFFNAGQTVTYDAFSTGEPNNVGNGEDCLVADSDGRQFQWVDIPCDTKVWKWRKVKALCEYSQSTGPSFGIETTDTWLVVTGGDNDAGRLKSSEIVSSTGVCDPIPPTTIPLLDMATTAGEMTFMQNRNLLVFCGGSTTFVPNTTPISAWGATNVCHSLPTIAPNAWSDTLVPAMDQERAWFSLSKVNADEMIAVGGIDSSGMATDSMEKYSFITNTWTYLPNNLPHQRFGHCTVHYFTGGKSYLIVIGGSKEVRAGDSWEAVKTVFKVDVATSATTQLADLPEALFRPACTISFGGEIYVSGGSVGTVAAPAGKEVYRYSFEADTWSHVGDMNNAGWGHVMGAEGAYANRKMSVAGGYSGVQAGGNGFRNSVEDSINGGVTWTMRRTNLLVEREYAASAEVPGNTFTCQP